jgi:hypothetical protein
MADEVYQTNIYAAGKEFFSFKKVRGGRRGGSVGGVEVTGCGGQQQQSSGTALLQLL